MAATGVAGFMLSEKEGIKNFFFGDARNKEKTFYQLTKENSWEMEEMMVLLVNG